MGVGVGCGVVISSTRKAGSWLLRGEGVLFV